MKNRFAGGGDEAAAWLAAFAAPRRESRVREGAPGPAPRPGLVWNDSTKRWVRPKEKGKGGAGKPKNPAKITIQQAAAALAKRGYELDFENSKFDLKRKTAVYRIKKPDGTTANVTADEIKAIVYREPEAGAASPAEPAHPRAELDRAIAAERDAEARDYLEAARHNADESLDPESAEGRRDALRQVADVWASALAQGKGEVADKLLAVAVRAGASVPAAVGESVEFSGRYYTSDSPAFTGDAARVVRPALVLAGGPTDYVLKKGVTTPA